MTSLKTVTNDDQDTVICEFLLSQIFEQLPDGATAFTSILSDGKFPYIPLSRIKKGPCDAQYYYCTMSVYSDSEDKIRRQDKNFAALHVIVLDDIGTKVQPNNVIPTYVIESSPGNFQWGYILEHPITDYTEANRIVRSIALHGKLSDKATNSCNRVVRLPLGINGKEGDKHDHKVRLVSFNPNLRFDPYKLLAQWGVGLDDANRIPHNVFTELADGVDAEQALASDNLYSWLAESGHIHSNISNSGFVKVDCPRAHEHSVQSFAGYSPLGYGDNPGRRVFKCFHSHEAGGGAPDTDEFLEWCAQEGGPSVDSLGPVEIVKPRAFIKINPKTELASRTLQNCILMLEEIGYDIKYDVMNDRVLVNDEPLVDVMLSHMILDIDHEWHVQFTSMMVYDAVQVIVFIVFNSIWNAVKRYGTARSARVIYSLTGCSVLTPK
jgi:hypothetical protein